MHKSTKKCTNQLHNAQINYKMPKSTTKYTYGETKQNKWLQNTNDVEWKLTNEEPSIYR